MGTADSARLTEGRELYVFDLDGTLLVSPGREIIEHDGNRAGIHPVIEEHVASVLPRDRRSDYRHCGEEDLHDDPHELIESAAVIASTAAKLREVLGRGEAEAAILTARAHDSAWLSQKLEKALGLPRAIRPDLIMCVYSRDFDKMGDHSTASRKAAAVRILVQRSAPDVAYVYDDVEKNLDAIEATLKPIIRVETFLVPFDAALEALRDHGYDPHHFFDVQCRDEYDMEPNALVQVLRRTISASNLTHKLPTLGHEKTRLNLAAVHPAIKVRCSSDNILP